MNSKTLAAIGLTFVSINLFSQTFKTVKIGEQTWMAENLQVETKGSSCYNFGDEFCAKYGKLYTWEAAQHACPSGWQLPTEQDWDALIEKLGGEDEAGNALKANGKSGFNALLGGLADARGFSLIGFCGTFWSASTFDKTHAWYYYLNKKDGLVTKTYFNKSYGFSVRCIKKAAK